MRVIRRGVLGSWVIRAALAVMGDCRGWIVWRERNINMLLGID
jgi:hypothetical protein